MLTFLFSDKDDLGAEMSSLREIKLEYAGSDQDTAHEFIEKCCSFGVVLGYLQESLRIACEDYAEEDKEQEETEPFLTEDEGRITKKIRTVEDFEEPEIEAVT